jgi:hypothetical protein
MIVNDLNDDCEWWLWVMTMNGAMNDDFEWWLWVMTVNDEK